MSVALRRRRAATPVPAATVMGELRLIGRAVAISLEHGPEKGLAHFIREVSAEPQVSSLNPNPAPGAADDDDIIEGEIVGESSR